MTTLGRLQVNLIERTSNPLAPIVMQEVADATEHFGRMLASIADPTEVGRITNRLLKDFPNDHDPIFGSPEFCMVLSALLKQSSIRFVQQCSK